jgi:hypothetical protein
MFSERDDASAPGVVIINETLARRLWSNGDPLTDRLLVGRILDPAYNKDPVRQIVGIVADVRDVALNRLPRPIMYVPAAQLPPVARIRGLEQVADESTARTRMNTLMMMFFAATALQLASVGIYGLLASSVEQRRREIGIRLALGASPGLVRRMVVLQTARLAMAGVAIGALSAAGLTRFLASLLYGVKSDDAVSFLAVPLVLGSVALVAGWIPAVFASRINSQRGLARGVAAAS